MHSNPAVRRVTRMGNQVLFSPNTLEVLCWKVIENGIIMLLGSGFFRWGLEIG
jgi:hypothetical protein